MTGDNVENFSFQAEVSELLKLVINSLYSHKEIFLRELISNASDALDKLRFAGVTNPEWLKEASEPEIRLLVDKEAKTLTIEDTGIGMSRDELIKNLGTIAHSGSKAFLQQLKENQGDMSLIGQFGVGFYSAYLVADKVEVISRGAGESESFVWASDAEEAFTIAPAEREKVGTSIVLHLKEDQTKYLETWELRQLVSRYSDYVSHPILVPHEKTEGEGEGAKTEVEWQKANRGTALWQKTPSSVEEEEYGEFYKHLTHDYDGPLAHSHFKLEGTHQFSGIVFIPNKAPFDLYQEKRDRGIRLYVKRVFIMEDCEEVIPPWLRFVRGVVDSDDLPLNVSREILQDSAITRVMQKQVIKKTLDTLEHLAADKQEDYLTFWNAFGAVLKEGIATDSKYRDRIVELCRFRSTKAEELTTLAAYLEAMPEGQKDIYYAVGESQEAVANSPYLEALRAKDYEVLLLSDPVDEWVMDSLREYKDKALVSVMRANLSLDDEESSVKAERTEQLKPLCDEFKATLSEKISEVKVSDRLTDTPCVLVVPEGAAHPSMERMLAAAGRGLPPMKRILELNPDHAVVKALESEMGDGADPTRMKGWMRTLYDQAVLLEGGKVEDPSDFARRVTELLQLAVTSSAAS